MQEGPSSGFKRPEWVTKGGEKDGKKKKKGKRKERREKQRRAYGA